MITVSVHFQQAPQYEVLQSFKDRIQILSFPNLTHLPWTSTGKPKVQYPTDTVEPWCFSHWPGANCFLTHFCASKAQKLKMNTIIKQQLISLYGNDRNNVYKMMQILYIDSVLHSIKSTIYDSCSS